MFNFIFNLLIGLYCTNLEILNVAGSREQISDSGFARYIETSSSEARSKLRQLDISRCMLSQRVLVIMQALTGEIILRARLECARIRLYLSKILVYVIFEYYRIARSSYFNTGI